MVFTRSYVFPIVFGFWLPLTVITTYTVSVLTNHVPAVLPYISDTGTWAPESCIFGIMVTLGALIMLVIVYIRYRQVDELKESSEFSETLRRLNSWSLYTGIVSVIGCLIVANFQVRFILIVHLIGAGLCFGFMAVYQVIQVIISFRIYPRIGNKKLNIFRIMLAILSIISLTVALVGALISFLQFKGNDITKWKPEDGGYIFHLASAAAEYVMTISIVLSIVTFVEEFKSVEIHQPVVNNKKIEQ